MLSLPCFAHHFDSVYIPSQIAFANSFLDLIVNVYLLQITSSQQRLLDFPINKKGLINA